MFPSRYFTQRYYAAAFWPKVGENPEILPTPDIWYISTRNKEWTININTSEFSIPERAKIWTISDTLSENVGELEYSWNLPTRIKEWTL